LSVTTNSMVFGCGVVVVGASIDNDRVPSELPMSASTSLDFGIVRLPIR